MLVDLIWKQETRFWKKRNEAIYNYYRHEILHQNVSIYWAGKNLKSKNIRWRHSQDEYFFSIEHPPRFPRPDNFIFVPVYIIYTLFE